MRKPPITRDQGCYFLTDGNLYLACEAIGAGTCAIAAYNQDLADRLVEVDGDEEFVVYLAPVGRSAAQR